VVIKATRNNAEVVIKLVKPADCSTERFAREVEAVRLLDSKYVPKIIETGIKEIRATEFLYLIEEHISGQTLREKLNTNLNSSEIIEIIQAILAACHDFEEARIVHRDLKPENIMIDDNQLWIIDFGIARHLDMESITKTGYRCGIGTVGYAAPEQFNNVKAEINNRTDLYALGIISYEMLLTRHPHFHPAKSPEDIINEMETCTLQKLKLPFDPTGEFAEWLWLLVQRFPSRRHQSANEALAWFTEILPNLNTE
jgi:serine/threonine-protein kinase